MYNQIRAEFYKLFHTKALYLTFALILAVFGIFSIGGQQQFVVSSSSVDETWKIGETVGFLARAYSDQVHPMIEEIIRTATSYVWILLGLGVICAILAWFLLQKSMGRFTYEKLLQ